MPQEYLFSFPQLGRRPRSPILWTKNVLENWNKSMKNYYRSYYGYHVTYFLKTTVTTEKFRSNCWIFSLNRFPKLDISDHLRIFDMNSIRETFTSLSRDQKYALFFPRFMHCFIARLYRILSRVPDSNLVNEIQFPRISFPFIVVVGIVEQAE